jgi:phosphotriesterase-related protein
VAGSEEFVAEGLVVTVDGPVGPDAIGFTLPHEHTSCRADQAATRIQSFAFTSDFKLIAREVGAFRAAGGSCLVDLTVRGVGRDPVWLRRLAARTGLHLVLSTGWYRESFFPPDARIDRRTIDDLADELVTEIERGVDGTGIRPGIIGEIGTDHSWVTPLEDRVHRAAARAAAATGLSLVTHSLGSRVGLAQLDLFEDEGLAPSRVVIGHADSVPELGYQLALLERGTNVCFDLIGHPDPRIACPEADLVAMIVALVARGYSRQLLVSQDVAGDAQLTANGGNGYAYLPVRFLPRLRANGITDETIEQMTVSNPRRILTVATS